MMKRTLSMAFLAAMLFTACETNNESEDTGTMYYKVHQGNLTTHQNSSILLEDGNIVSLISRNGENHLLTTDQNGLELSLTTLDVIGNLKSFTRDASGNYYICGNHTWEHLNEMRVEMYLAKTDAEGNLLWHVYYEVPGSDWAKDVSIAGDGGILIAGDYYDSENQQEGIRYLKADPNTGQLQWIHSYAEGNVTKVEDVLTDESGRSYIIAMQNPFSTGSHLRVIAIDANGETIYSNPYELGGHVKGLAGVMMDDGSIAICGQNNSYDQLMLVNIDQTGAVVWDHFYGLPDHVEFGNSLLTTADGDVVMAGSSFDMEAQQRSVYLLKVNPDATGEEYWQSRVGNGSDLHALNLMQNNGGDFFITGSYSDQILFMKFNSEGENIE